MRLCWESNDKVKRLVQQHPRIKRDPQEDSMRELCRACMATRVPFRRMNSPQDGREVGLRPGVPSRRLPPPPSSSSASISSSLFCGLRSPSFARTCSPSMASWNRSCSSSRCSSSPIPRNNEDAGESVPVCPLGRGAPSPTAQSLVACSKPGQAPSSRKSS